jgi:fructokinase
MEMILACGEALIDLFLYDRTGSRIAAEAVAGGSPFNVAIGLARLGRRVAFCGGLSTDSFGEFLSGILASEGVDLSYALRTPRLTTISVVSTDAAGQPRYSFHGEGAADRSITPDDLQPTLSDEFDALTFGSYTLAVEPVASAYLVLANREAHRRVISIDPNIRPTVIGDLSGYDRRLLRFFRTATIIKASEEDINLVYGSEAAISEVARAWLKQGPPLVVITRGNKGALAFHKDRSVEVPGRKVDVVDTVGAGDSFHAALLSSLAAANQLRPEAIRNLSTQSLEHVLQYAITASSITCSRRGADLPTSKEVTAAMWR